MCINLLLITKNTILRLLSVALEKHCFQIVSYLQSINLFLARLQ